MYYYSITLLGFSPTPRTFHASNSRIVDTCGNYIYLKSSLSCFKKKLIYIYSLCKIGIGTNFVTCYRHFRSRYFLRVKKRTRRRNFVKYSDSI